MSESERKVVLREERSEHDLSYLEAYVDSGGALHIDGQDLGPGTEIISSDGEYEWFQTVAAGDVPRLLALLGGTPGEDILDVLERYTGERSYELEKLLHSGGIPYEFTSW